VNRIIDVDKVCDNEDGCSMVLIDGACISTGLAIYDESH
jgi:hypothetical protein